jgi:hypothetical protein
MAKESSPKQEPEKPRQGRYFQFMVDFDEEPDEMIETTAYAFDAFGNLLASAAVKKGVVRLPLTEKQAKTARLYFAPAPPEEEAEQGVTLEMMSRLRAYEPAWRFEPGERVYKLLDIPRFHWDWWLWCACRVRGQVVKPVVVEGVTYDMPVCNARVHVCEVDRLWWVLERIPDDIVFRLRDELLEIIRRPIPIPDPLPDPPFRFDPGVIDPSPIALAQMNYTQQLQKNINLDLSSKMLNPQPLPPRDNPGAMVNFAKMQRFSQETGPQTNLLIEDMAALHSPAVNIVRDALLANVAVIYPYLCWWDWLWPFFYTCDEVAVLETNHDGRFDGSFWYLCFGDQPDLYFWVEYNIGGVWTTVYHPPLRCNIYWNYACGSEVTLRVTDPRVPWCGDTPPLPGKQLAVLTIGNAVSMTEIQRAVALTNEGLTMTGQPFGGSLEPTVWFGEDLLPAISHYRWSYRRLGSTGSWTAIDAPVSRHYAEVMADSTLAFKPFPLGPDPSFPGQNLYKIPPADPPLIAPAVSSSWAPQVNGRANTASAFFESYKLEGGDAALGAGKYELMLELFDTAGIPVNLTAAGVKLKVPTIDAPFGTNVIVPTREVPVDLAHPLDNMEERVIRNGSGDIVAFRVVLHVDNNPCYAEIEDVTVDSQPAGPCGFIEYDSGDDAVISFIARHPNNFATFSFNVYKGSTGAIVSANGGVGDAVVDGFTRDIVSRFTKSIPVADLVGSCPGGKAAFSENLHVNALATDGWSSLNYLDRYGTPKAFALEPGLVVTPATPSP